MMNWLVISALGVLLLGGASARKDDKTSPPAAEIAGDSAKGIVSPMHVVIDQPLPANEEKPLRRFAGPEWVTAYITAIYVIIAGLTLSAIRRQAEESRDSAAQAIEIAKKSADAALLNAQAVINAERARILFETGRRLNESTFKGVATFTIFAVNRGKVPAEIINYGKAAEICITPTNTLPPEPKYQLADPPTVRFVVSGDRHPVTEFQPGMPGITWRLVRDAEGPLPDIADMHLTVYGEVTYKDGISDQIRHSRYCFEWFREAGIQGGSLRPAGPHNYNECT
jgi:hypothetical protein